MALSPYLKPSVLNNGGGYSSLRTSITEGILGKSGDFDKRETKSLYSDAEVTTIVSSAKSIKDTLTNALGTRSPYYIIGEIPSNDATRLPQWAGDTLGNVVRAVTSLAGNAQEGVIIDAFDSFSGDISIEFTSNPVVFVSGTIMDNRMRTPNKVSATIMVSNHMTDNAINTAVNFLTSMDPTGLSSEVANQLMYGGNTRAQAALYKLRWLQENGQPFTVYTPHGIYQNMLIKSLKPKTTDKTVDMLLCDVEFCEIMYYEPYISSSSVKQPARTNILEKSELNELTGKLKSWVSSVTGSKK